MNWKRIWIGSGIAALVLWLFDIGNLIVTQRFMGSEPNLAWSEIGPIATSLIAPSIVMGFLLSWLYVLARPRLGPGPKTAFIMGSIGFAFANPHFFGIPVWMASPTSALILLIAVWVKFAVATFLAGWQYIEKAPE